MLGILLEIAFNALIFTGKPKRRLGVVIGIAVFSLGVVVVSIVRHTIIG